ncbi:MAG: signal recognition particle-docking protein FtsY [Arcanobacterium sp.]|nr:signal recognition particle-docking protein FtsY [Arcanobacterium sp.]
MKYRRDASRGNQLPWEARKPLEQHPIEDAEIVSDIPDDARDLIDAEEQAGVEQPESVPSRMQRLRARLARSGALGNALLSILSRAELKAEDWEELEETLLMADLGIEPTTELLETLQREMKVQGTQDPAAIRQILRAELLKLVAVEQGRELNLLTPATEAAVGGVAADTEAAELAAVEASVKEPAVILMVGVNGTGKTTTTGKLSRLLVAEGKKVVLGAADTFRAAAAEQLQTWGERVGVEVVRSDKEGADPASVGFEAVKYGREIGADVVIVDTAGRLQNKAGLMDELGKIKRVIEKQAPVREVLLVLDATTGQNGLRQAEVFAEVTGVTGIVLSKLDGTAKGGIVVAVQRELGVPVKFVGLGEGADDLAPFDPESFVDSILA